MKTLSGKSMSREHPMGIRRRDRNGNDRAPRSLRAKHPLMSDCSQKELFQRGIISDRGKDEQ